MKMDFLFIVLFCIFCNCESSNSKNSDVLNSTNAELIDQSPVDLDSCIKKVVLLKQPEKNLQVVNLERVELKDYVFGLRGEIKFEYKESLKLWIEGVEIVDSLWMNNAATVDIFSTITCYFFPKISAYLIFTNNLNSSGLGSSFYQVFLYSKNTQQIHLMKSLSNDPMCLLWDEKALFYLKFGFGDSFDVYSDFSKVPLKVTVEKSIDQKQWQILNSEDFICE